MGICEIAMKTNTEYINSKQNLPPHKVVDSGWKDVNFYDSTVALSHWLQHKQ